MKKEYIKPIIEMIDFQAKDTIMTDDENEKIYNPDFELGFVAAVNKREEAIVPDFESAKVFSGKVSLVHDYLNISVVGVSKEYSSVNVIFCLYAKDKAGVFFLDGGKTLTSVTGISYDSLNVA